MLALTDYQIELIFNALRPLKNETERASFLKLLDEQLKTRDIDVVAACEAATRAVTAEKSNSPTPFSPRGGKRPSANARSFN